jgi:Tol biopolymer transport system component
VKPLHRTQFLLSGLCLGLIFAGSAQQAQNATQPASGGPAAQAPRPKYRTHFMVYDVQKKTTKTILTVDGEWHAPNYSPDGKFFVSDMGGSLYRIPLSGDKAGKPEKIDISQKMMATNDHALSWDGKLIAITGIVRMPTGQIRSAADIHNPLYIMNMDGSNAHEIHLGWLHGWSPDGKYVVYAQYNKDNFDIYRVNADGGGELLMTTNKAQDDGPEFSGDGKWVYFNSMRSGKWDGWRMPPDGAGPDDKLAERITFGSDTQDYFAHISPDSKWLYTISYPMDHPDHQYIGADMKIKVLPLVTGVPAKGAELKTVATFFGGQGSGNTGGWAPDSKKFAWTVYEALPEGAAK